MRTIESDQCVTKVLSKKVYVPDESYFRLRKREMSGIMREERSFRMSFRGYKLKAKLYAAHSNIEGAAANIHFHTFTLVLYLKDRNEDTYFFYSTEKKINEWLAPYQDKILAETELFCGKSTTLESIGDTFYDEWKEKARELQLDLIRLDIYENPVRTYSVSDRLLDADVNEISAMPYVLSDIAAEGKKSRGGLQTLQTHRGGSSNGRGTGTGNSGAKNGGYDRKGNGIRTGLKASAAVILFAVAACVIWFSMKISGNYPQGSDTLCHLYRADLLLQKIREGVFYPLYDKMWYNGVEIMRYWAPLPLYILAGLEAAAGSLLDGYLLFVVVVFFVGAVGWLLLGIKLNRIGFATFIGVVWFFLPENMRLIILDGNLPRVVINTAMPFVLLAVWNVVEEKRWKHVIPLTLLVSFLGLCHIGIALMVVATLLIFLCFYGKMNKSWREVRMVLVSVFIGLLLTGIWLIPSLHGSGAGNSDGGNQVMQYFFESAFVSLNPVPRWNGNLTTFYYGVSILVISLAGIVFGTRKTLPGFVTGVIIFACTTKSVYALFAKLPFSQFLWMIRFVTISFAFIMLSLLLWKGLKRSVVLLLCGLLLLDCIPSYRYIYEEEKNRTADVAASQYELGERLLLNQAKEITNQRMALFDLSTYGAFAPYYVAGVEKKTAYTFGAGWEGARTASNIVKLNSAIENGRYAYVFDRSLELGNDTLIFDVSVLKNKENDVAALIAEGERQGYELVDCTEKNLLFHRKTQKSFGVVTKYENIAIGRAATDIALLFPTFEEGTSENLSDYTVEELAGYQRIYLSDFTYADKATAEAMLTELAERGVKIYIDMNKAPVNKATNLQELFGVSVQNITFWDNFPTIEYNGKQYHTRGFISGMEEWKANYLIGLSEITGYGEMEGIELSFSGTKTHDNIIFLGYNFVYYSEISDDIIGIELLSDIFDVSPEELPEREIVPLTVLYEDGQIVIHSERDGVNTTLADIDIFSSDKNYQQVNHFIVVDAGTTVLTMHYPYWKEGMAVTISGAFAYIGYIIYLFHKDRMQKKMRKEG